ncbi:hypothetical protein TNIN_282051, partial [Trichonephila inaurata madagascariensis]
MEALLLRLELNGDNRITNGYNMGKLLHFK